VLIIQISPPLSTAALCISILVSEGTVPAGG
jgi:hypothetical protein